MNTTPPPTMSITTSTQIFWFWPNITGYVRIVLSLLSFIVYKSHPQWFFVLYVLSFLLDAVDGHLARWLNQCSRFGAVLDMVTDRFSTAILCVILALLYQDYAVWFMYLIVLDIVSHWFRMYSTLLQGTNSHKQVDPKQWKLLYIYYTNRIVLGLVCLFNELFYAFLYAFYFFPNACGSLFVWGEHTPVVLLFVYVCFPVFALKQIINLIQLVVSCQDICEWDFVNNFQRSG